jgi:hypothetical protein
MKIKRFNCNYFLGYEAFFFTPVIAWIKDKTGSGIWLCWFKFMFYIELKQKNNK